ncbi:Membrane protein involved in the export of O-antigen and teichoic acid [Eubacterium ruminantium]|nr:Membrane protein involved in the export of O-antigen and teichoic acid [Eubacterium ruminantium]
MNEARDNKLKEIGYVMLFLCLTFPFYQVPLVWDNIGKVPLLYTILETIVGGIIVLLILKDRMVKKISPIFLLFGAILFTMCLAAKVNGNSGVKVSFQYAFATIVICLVIEYGIHRDLKSFLEAQIIFFGSLTYSNFILAIIYRKGMYDTTGGFYPENWLLGFKSGHIAFQMAFLFFLVMFCVIYERKMYFVYVSTAVVIISSLLVKNRTALMTLLPLVLFLAFSKVLKLNKIFNSITFSVLGIFLTVFFVVLRGQNMFKWLIVDIFHKRLDLTNRIYVWDKAIKEIKEFPVLGHGYQTFRFNSVIVTTHNEFVEVLYKCGIIGLVIFLLIIGYSVYKLFKNKKEMTSQWISVFLLLYLFMFVMEQHAFANFFFIFVFAAHAGRFKEIREEQEKASDEEKSSAEAGRTGKSAKNFLFTLVANFAAILIGLLAQKLFIKILGLEYAGLNGLFSNVITMLAIVDLGIGEAVVFHLYKPLKEKDETLVLSLMKFYRKAFHIVAGIISVIGICLIPVLPLITGKVEADVNLTLVFIIYLLDVVLSYFLSYKRSILYADQKNYFISIVHIVYLISVNTAQLLMLYFTHDYYLYLLIKLAFRILENVVISVMADKMYPFLRKKKAEPLSRDVLADIKKKVGALFFHKIGTFVVNGTDNILISVFLSIKTVGLYNNYFLVTDAATKLFQPAIAALTPSVGNMLISEDREHTFRVFKRIRFMNFWIAAFAASSMAALIQPFIAWWFGKKYVLPLAVAIILSLQFFQLLMRGTFSAFQDAAGIFYENRFVPLVESLLNLVSSIILLKIFGLAGVFAGTIISSMALWAFSYPKFVYKKLFERRISDYVKEMLGYLILFLIIAATTYISVYLINDMVSLEGFKQLLLDGVLCMIIPNMLMALMFIKNESFRYFLGMILKKFRS